MRLDYALSNAGAGSRRQVKALILRGRVIVNGDVVKNPDAAVEEADEVTVEGERIDISRFVYIMLNKPKGYVCTNDGEEKNVFSLLPDSVRGRKLFCVGRLDRDTTGLLLITDDGDFAHRIISPKKGCEKTYIATLERPVTREDIDAFGSGLLLGNGERALPALLEPTAEEKRVRVTLSEGKYHQVKRMFGARQNRVTELCRVKVGQYVLPDTLKIGDFSFVSVSIEKKS